MKMCQEHWDKLKKAIVDKGLESLILKDGIELVERLKKEIDEQVTIGDPLVNANFAIMNNAIEQGGIYLLSSDGKGNPYCPLCELGKYTDIDPDTWIEYASKEQREKAEKWGLVGGN